MSCDVSGDGVGQGELEIGPIRARDVTTHEVPTGTGSPARIADRAFWGRL